MYRLMYDLTFDQDHWTKECRAFRFRMLGLIVTLFAFYGAIGLAAACLFNLDFSSAMTVSAVVAGMLSILPVFAVIGATPRKVWRWQDGEIYVKA